MNGQDPSAAATAPRIVDQARRDELLQASVALPAVTLADRQLADLELLLNGGFHPLTGFMTREQYLHCCFELRLPEGQLWPVPVTLPVPAALATRLGRVPLLALRDPAGVLLAVLHVEDVFEPDLRSEAAAVYGTISEEHPGVRLLFQNAGSWYVGGRLEGLGLPRHGDFRDLRKTPAELRQLFYDRGWERVVAFQTRNPMHRAHVEMTLRAALQHDARILLHPVVGPTRPGDLGPQTRVRCYRAVLQHYPPRAVELAVLPLAMRMAGPREALLHAIVRRNHGCSHLIVGRDHGGPGLCASTGEPFYLPDAAQELVLRHQQEIGICAVPFPELRYVPSFTGYRTTDELAADLDAPESETLSGTDLRRRLEAGEELPSWFTFPEVERILRQAHQRRRGREAGLVVLFTGLPGAGKSVLAEILAARLEELGHRVSVLDGGELDRDIGPVAVAVAHHGGIAICAAVAASDDARQRFRQRVEAAGRFVLVHVDTPAYVCAARDPKGDYHRARAGQLPGFVGLSDDYQEPPEPDLVVDTLLQGADATADGVLGFLVERGLVGSDPVIPAPPRGAPPAAVGEPVEELVEELVDEILPSVIPPAGTTPPARRRASR